LSRWEDIHETSDICRTTLVAWGQSRRPPSWAASPPWHRTPCASRSSSRRWASASSRPPQKAPRKRPAELGDVEIIYTGPTDTTAEGQIEVINSLIAQGVDAIAISANDPDALVPP
jgi:hypothetical protein